MNGHDITVHPTIKLSGQAGWHYECSCGKTGAEHSRSLESARRAGEEHATHAVPVSPLGGA